MEAKRELEAEKTQKEALLERQDHTLVSENLKPTALHSDGLNGPIWHDITLFDSQVTSECEGLLVRAYPRLLLVVRFASHRDRDISKEACAGPQSHFPSYTVFPGRQLGLSAPTLAPWAAMLRNRERLVGSLQIPKSYILPKWTAGSGVEALVSMFG
eukprot:1155863-Pelagomonas_calceolata.AAC.2